MEYRLYVRDYGLGYFCFTRNAYMGIDLLNDKLEEYKLQYNLI